MGGGDEDDGHDGSEYRLEEDQSVGETKTRRYCSSRSITNNEPCCPWEAVIEDFCYDSNVCVDVGRDDQVGIYICDP